MYLFERIFALRALIAAAMVGRCFVGRGGVNDRKSGLRVGTFVVELRSLWSEVARVPRRAISGRAQGSALWMGRVTCAVGLCGGCAVGSGRGF